MGMGMGRGLAPSYAGAGMQGGLCPTPDDFLYMGGRLNHRARDGGVGYSTGRAGQGRAGQWSSIGGNFKLRSFVHWW
jgi:hypothetical protein